MKLALYLTEEKVRVYTVYIAKWYFPKELWPKGEMSEVYDVVRIKASSRREAANKVWAKKGKEWLEKMNPKETSKRIVSLAVDEPSAASYDRGKKYMGGGAASRLMPVKVYEE